jgi:phosphoribosylamine--glycine ligase
VEKIGNALPLAGTSPMDNTGALAWVGRDGLIVFDESGFGQFQDDLRSSGYAVVGGCAGADLLEHNRPYCQGVLASCGIRTLPTEYFPTAHDAINFIETHRGRWVIKQNGHAEKTFCYAGQLESGEDVLDILRQLQANATDSDTHVVLQRRVDGVEIGVGRYFNGTDWIGPIEMNIVHKKLFPGNLGPKTCEMGTLVWYDDDETNRLFREVLAPLAVHLREIRFHGDVDVNCIVNKQGAWPLEVTPRFGYPSTAIQIELHESPWGDFLRAVAIGQPYDLKWRSGYGIAVLAATPPFPFAITNSPISPCGLLIHFHKPPDAVELTHCHFEEALRLSDGTWEICGNTGYTLHVTGHGSTVAAAREATCRRLANLVIPRMYYRTDIGAKFASHDQQQLKDWGYL